MTSKVFDVTPDCLACIGVLTGVDRQGRAEIAAHCIGRRYRPKMQIIFDGDSSTDIYFVISGKVRATIFSKSGKEVSFRDLGRGETFGDLSALDESPRCASVVTLEESMVVSMTAAAFWDAMREYPEIWAAVLRDLTKLARRLTERVVEFSTLGVKNRIHAELLRLAKDSMLDDKTAEIRPSPRHPEIASRVSTHREAVTRELNHLIQIGILKKADHCLLVCDVQRLSKFVEQVKGS